MPTLFRFLFVLGLVAGVVTGSLYVLAEYFQPVPKEISKTLRNVKVRDEVSTPAPAPVENQVPGDSGGDSGADGGATGTVSSASQSPD
jgi:hypothetical protein